MTLVMSFLGSLLSGLIFAQAATAQPTEAWQRLRNQLQHATVTFALRDLETNTLVLDYNAQASMVPASTLKLLPTAYALHQFAPEQRWQTQVVLPQPVVNGVAPQVNIIGSGDPTLGSPQIAGNPDTAAILQAIVQAIEVAGIRQIGALAVDTSMIAIEPVPRSWTYDDIGNYYGTSVAALNINDNLYELWLQPGAVGQPATLVRTEPAMPWLHFTNFMGTGSPDSGDQGYIFGIPGHSERLLRGTIPAGTDFVIYGSLPDPADAFLRWLEAALAEAGISVGERQVNATPATGQVIWQHSSPTLAAIVEFTLRASMNLYADTLLVLAAQQERSTVVDWPTATNTAQAWLEREGLTTAGLRLEDGSGLSRRNLVTAAAMSDLVAYASRQSWWSTYQAGLRSLSSPVRPEGAVRGKNGFIAGVRTLSGVIQTRNQRTYAFSLLVNHFQGSIAETDAAMSEFLDVIWEQY